MHCLSISLDASITTSGSDARARQRNYAAELDRLTVVVKTDAGEGTFQRDGPLQVIPTQSRNRYSFLLDAYRTGRSICKRQDVDVVTVQDPFAVGMVGWLLRQEFDVALHTQVHSDFLENDAWRTDKWEHRVFDKLGRFVLPRSDAIRVGTEYEASKIRTFVPSDTKVMVAPVRMDFDKTVADTEEGVAELREKLAVDDRPVVLFAGRFVAAKALERWIDVASRTIERTDRDPVFVLVGDGPELEALEQAAQSAGIGDSVRLPGWVDPATLARYYRMASVFLLTSKYEGTSRVIVEAGMNELPVVSTLVAGAIDNVADGETGYVCDTTERLADRVVYLVENPATGARMGATARERLADQFDPGRLREKYVEFLIGSSDSNQTSH